ncbi:hypothetical protein GGTG_14097 [Gaeumannomyces tritici R3-111a-1]|uniref:Uncharacterized protein n=1 Tax=Gaeumannomyces tritici (strain R3-111a-1) TaxID=644352 RepID=J3PKN4_GAET3|nr:hypothetical protein GGTG_14097 [Gaeumannomyces tritici R3-111a-1]EJT68323.1 hypothetical protein GGTG_14097 [Gaeumannomyces tritici R3-111a-1]
MAGPRISMFLVEGGSSDADKVSRRGGQESLSPSLFVGSSAQGQEICHIREGLDSNDAKLP